MTQHFITQADTEEMKSAERNPVIACRHGDPEDDRTDQSKVKETDINWILERHGINPFGTKQRPVPMEFRTYDQHQEFHEDIQAANEVRMTWEALPPDVRRRWRSPAELLEASLTGDFEKAHAGAVPPHPPTPPDPAGPKNPPPDPAGEKPTPPPVSK